MSVRMTFIDLFMAGDPIKTALKAVIISNPRGHNSREDKSNNDKHDSLQRQETTLFVETRDHLNALKICFLAQSVNVTRIRSIIFHIL